MTARWKTVSSQIGRGSRSPFSPPVPKHQGPHHQEQKQFSSSLQNEKSQQEEAPALPLRATEYHLAKWTELFVLQSLPLLLHVGLHLHQHFCRYNLHLLGEDTPLSHISYADQSTCVYSAMSLIDIATTAYWQWFNYVISMEQLHELPNDGTATSV